MLAGLYLHGQENETNFRFGMHASPNISWINSNDPDVSQSSSLKFGFGLISEYYFAKNYAFSGGIDIVSRGSEMTLEGDTLAGDFKATYIQIPIKLKMRSRQFDYFRGFAEFGGAVAIEVSENADFEPRLPDNLIEPSFVNPINFVFTVGLGAEYDLGGSTSVLAGIYYNRSLVDNLDNDFAELNDKYSYRFDYVNLRLGFLF